MSSRTWGPFSGSQLTMIILGVALCFAIPGGLWAAATVQYSFVSLYDAKSKQSAKLGAGGALKVTNGVGPLAITGNVAASGTSTEAAPSSLMRFATEVTQSSCVPILAAPSTNGIVLTRLVLDTFLNNTPGISTGLFFYIGSTVAACGAFYPVFSIHPPAFAMNDIDLHPGFAIPAGSFLWAKALGGVQSEVYGTGYFVPASAIPAATALSAQVGPGTKGGQQVR